MTSCRSCGAPIKWVTMRASGKPNPLDPDERSDGNVVIEADGMGAVLPKGAAYTGPRYASHFSTCPNADEHRRKKPGP